MHSSHLIRATGAASPCIKSLQTPSTKCALKHGKSAGVTVTASNSTAANVIVLIPAFSLVGQAGRTAQRHISTLRTSRHPQDTEIGGSKSMQRLRLTNLQPFGSSSRSITSSALSYSPATALAFKPPSQYIPRFDGTPLPRRQSLTAGESRKIEDMFSSIFDAASHQEELTESQNEEEAAPWKTYNSPKPIPVQWTRPEDNIIDVMKEEIERCESDHALHAWTLERLFAELDGTLSQVQSTSALESTNNEISSPEGMQQGPASLPAFAYPQLLAIVMRTFRTKYRDPHAALALFDHAHSASTVSYVTCCGTAAYNELIETKWDSFRDLQGVCDALEEMSLNKVRIDTRTHKLLESLRREVGQRNFWQEEGFGESHSGVMDLLERIEGICWPAVDAQTRMVQNQNHQNRFAPQKWKLNSEVWKRPISSDEQDRLEFV